MHTIGVEKRLENSHLFLMRNQYQPTFPPFGGILFSCSAAILSLYLLLHRNSLHGVTKMRKERHYAGHSYHASSAGPPSTRDRTCFAAAPCKARPTYLGGQTIAVELFNGTTLPAQIVGTAPSDDLAVLKVKPSQVKLTAATIGDSSKLKVGQDVLAIGNPLGITQTVTNGIVSALGRNVSEGPNGALIPNAIQTDAPINPGNSGGALVDLQGNLVGIPTLTAIDPEFKTPANGVGFAIPSNR